MYPIHLTILPPPAILKNEVECVRIAEYSGGEGVAIKVAPNGLAGIVFHQSGGQAALEQIVTDQSHFIRDIRTFSGMTPTSLAHKVDDFYHDRAGYSFV